MSSIENAGMMSKEALDTSMKSLSAVTTGLQKVASETTEFTKTSYEQSAKMMEQLLQSRSLDKVIEVQNEFAKSAYQAWMSQATKLGEIYADIAKETYKPFEAAISNSTAAFRKAA